MAYTKNVGEQTVEFNRPSIDQIDRYLKAGQKGITKASTQLCMDTVKPECRDAWVQAVEGKPGLAVQVANVMLEDLGYAGDDSD